MVDDESGRSRTDSRERAPEWRATPERSAAPAPRPLWPIFDTGSAATNWLLNLLLLVALCILIMALAGAVLRQWRAGADVAPNNIITPQRQQAAAPTASSPRPPSFEQVARRRAEQEASQRRRAAIQQHETEEAERRRIAEREASREREWRAYYKKPAYCDESQATIDSVGCANDYIRARRAFDEKFAAQAR